MFLALSTNIISAAALKASIYYRINNNIVLFLLETSHEKAKIFHFIPL